MVPSSLKAASVGALLSIFGASAGANNIAADVSSAIGLTQTEVHNLQIDGYLDSTVLVDVTIDNFDYQLQMHPHSVRTQNYQVLEQLSDGSLINVAPAPVRTYRGTMLGAPGSTVSGSIEDTGLYARIQMNGTEWWIQPIAQHVPSARPSQHAIYKTSWVLPVSGMCGSDSLATNVQNQDFGSFGAPSTHGILNVAELACDTDFEYFQDYGSSTAVQNRINTVINAMNSQYETEVDITHEIGTIIVRSSSNDPYSSNDAGTLLNQFRSEWVNNQGGVSRDIAHMFTGRSINGGTIGIAWLGVICNSNFGYGLVESDFTGNFSCTTDLSAHELGHNWNAGHCSCSSNTMNPFITCANTFTTGSRNSIISHRNSRSCLSTGGPGETELFSDGFESGDFTAGGWVLTTSRPRVKTAARRTGSWGSRIRRSSAIERTVSTAGFKDIRVEFSRRTRNLDAGENLTVEWFNGSSWIIIEVVGDTGNAWSDLSFDLPSGANNRSNFRVRFTTNASQGKERGDVDNVKTFGVPL
ncbi:MAG: hypothetical protein ACI841_004374 [Planctomycetota bacterium]|jgi:hypothetical protein